MADWQPIETAPKDGTLVLTIGHPDTRIPSIFNFKGKSWGPEIFLDGGYYPTHWMPLPKPPKAAVDD